MERLIRLYQRCMPEWFRKPFWHVRHFAKRVFLAFFWPSERRTRLRQVRLRFGMPIARVPLDHAKLLVDVRDIGVGKPLYVHRSYEPEETSLVRCTVKKGMTFFDAGANIGYFSTLASQLVGDSGRVFAVEPEPHNCDLLRRNVRNNRCGNVTVIESALGAKPDTGHLFLSTESNLGDHQLRDADEHRPSIDVAIQTVDQILHKHQVDSIDFFKLDVQGYELHVLEGATGALSKSPDVTILCEIWPYGLSSAHSSLKSLIDFFASSGFCPYSLCQAGIGERLTWNSLIEHFELVSDPSVHAYTNIVVRRAPS